MDIGNSIFFGVIIFVAMGFTIAGYAMKMKQMAMLAAIFWASLGGFSFYLSLAAWDLYYIIGFAAFFIMIGEGYQAWGFMTKKEETEDDAELDFEGQLEKSDRERKEANATRRTNSQARLDAQNARIKAAAERKYFGK